VLDYFHVPEAASAARRRAAAGDDGDVTLLSGAVAKG
jgi:hypothetical protein